MARMILLLSALLICEAALVTAKNMISDKNVFMH
jgi:hypothetical protein